MHYSRLIQAVRRVYGACAFGPFAKYHRFGNYWTGEVHVWEGKDHLAYESSTRCDTRDDAVTALFNELKGKE